MDAIRPSSSNFLFELFLTQVSIRQLPGPISLLINPEILSKSFTIVIFEIPPILKKQTGNLIFFDNLLNDEKLELKGAPCPPFKMSLFLKL